MKLKFSNFFVAVLVGSGLFVSSFASAEDNNTKVEIKTKTAQAINIKAETQATGTSIESMAIPVESNSLSGIWLNEQKDAFVKIEEANGEVNGFIYAVKNERKDKKDIENSDESLRDRNVLGLKNLIGFKLEEANRAEGGKAYDPKNGKTYSAKMWLDNSNTLKIRGFIGFSLLGRTATFTRVVGTPQTEAEKLGLVCKD